MPRHVFGRTRLLDEPVRGPAEDVGTDEVFDRIENTRMPNGVGEPLDQTDSEMRGIRIKATYLVELAVENAKSSQRTLQAMIDEPAQIFYGFGLETIQGRRYPSNLAENLEKASIY